MLDYKYINEKEFAAEILLSTMDKVGGENWNNFEEALAYIDFSNKLPRPNHKEDETEEEDNILMKDYFIVYGYPYIVDLYNVLNIGKIFFNCGLEKSKYK